MGICTFPLSWILACPFGGYDRLIHRIPSPQNDPRHNRLHTTSLIFYLQGIQRVKGDETKGMELFWFEWMVQLCWDICARSHNHILFLDNSIDLGERKWRLRKLALMVENRQYSTNFTDELPALLFNQDLWLLCSFCKAINWDHERHGPMVKRTDICNFGTRFIVLRAW